MDSFPSILDDEQRRDRISQGIEKARSEPFSIALKEWLEEEWSSEPSGTDQWNPSSILALMTRREDVATIQDLAQKHNRQVEAFYMYWAAGLYDEARALAEHSAEVRERVGLSTPGIGFFEVCECLAGFGIWGRCQEARNFMLAAWHYGENFRRGLDSLSLQGVKTLILAGPPGTEKEQAARAVHKLAQRASFEVVDCSILGHDPQGLIESCQYKGTVFLKRFDDLSPPWRTQLLQAINQQRLLKKIRTLEGEFVERQPLDTLFILGVDSGDLDIGMAQYDQSIIGTKGIVEFIPPLAVRQEDIPILVNRVLLELGETRLDAVRDLVAEVLMDYYEEHEPAGEVDWLRSEVRRWVREFSPETILPEEGTDVESRVAGSEPQLKHVNAFLSDGAFWSITYEGQPLSPLKNLDGFLYIAYLLQHPNEDVPISTLRALKDKGQPDPRHQPYEKMSQEQLGEEGLSASTLDDSGEILDQQACEEYQSRLQELEAEVEEDHSDPAGRVERLEEIKALKEQLSAGIGLGGRPRKIAGKKDSDRSAVTMAIKAALDRIKENHQLLWTHLSNCIDTGNTCKYHPETSITWSP